MRDLKNGSRGKDVKTLQELLNQLGNRLIVDGVFGPATEHAVTDFQRFSGLQADGVVGDNTWRALQGKTAPSPSPDAGGGVTPPGIFEGDDFVRRPTWDSHTDRRIRQLHPLVQANARKVILLLEKEMNKTVRVTSGFRSFAEQDALFAQGRTAPGKKVTNARGGESYHNYGVAFDVVEIKKGKAVWDNRDWEKMGALGERLGFEWGGRWTGFTDRPHFQMTFGRTTADLLALFQSGQRDENFVFLG